MATDFAIVVSGLGLVGDGYDNERGAALHRIRDRMASLEEQLQTVEQRIARFEPELHREQARVRELEEQLEAAQGVLCLVIECEDALIESGYSYLCEAAEEALASNPVSGPRA